MFLIFISSDHGKYPAGYSNFSEPGYNESLSLMPPTTENFKRVCRGFVYLCSTQTNRVSFYLIFVIL